MGTTLNDGAVDVGAVEDSLNSLLLDSRASLPLALNNRHKAPSDPKAAQIRKEIAQGIKHPWRALWIVKACDVDDDVPLSEVFADLDRFKLMLEARAADRHLRQIDRPLPTLMQRTAKETGELTLAMLKLATSPESVDALEAVMREADDLPLVAEELSTACELAVVRTTTRVAYGSRRPMELSR